jgi:hypothetical protein
MSAIQEALDLWNETAVVCGWPIVRRLTSDRERKLRSILRNGLDDWKEALAKAQVSDFLCGKTERAGKYENYRFNIDTMLREPFFVRLLEGVYDNRETPQTFKGPETILWEARLKSYKPGGFWLGLWGPKPGEEGCQAPRSLLEQWQQRHLH